ERGPQARPRTPRRALPRPANHGLSVAHRTSSDRRRPPQPPPLIADLTARSPRSREEAAHRRSHGRPSVITYKRPMATVAPQTDPVAAVGPRVRALREAMSLSLRDLAERSGVSAQMLSQVERGET